MELRGKQTTLCYIERDEEYLMLHRTKKTNDENHDKWIGIGGKFEAFESPYDCVLREAKEETGLTLTSLRYRGIITFVSDQFPVAEYMHLFTTDGFTGEIIPCDEGDLEWIRIEDLLRLPMWEGDKIFLELLWKDAPFFLLTLRYSGDTLLEAILDGKKIK